MRIVFFGGGAFGLPALRAIFSSRHKIAAIVTQPDRTGRGHHRHVNPIKQEAESRTRPLLQPANVNAPEVLEELAGFGADLFLTAAYGQLLKKPFLEIPPAGCLNLHASLLPKYRGASPIHAALRKGERETGVSIFRIVRKLDAGPILSVERTLIEPDETTGQLHDRLAELAAPQTLQLLDARDDGPVSEYAQDDALASYAPQLRKEDGRIDWHGSAEAIANHVRGMTPWPGASTELRTAGRSATRLVITAARPAEQSARNAEPPGTIVAEAHELLVWTGDGLLRIERLKPAGKGEMSGDAFLRGWAGSGTMT